MIPTFIGLGMIVIGGYLLIGRTVEAMLIFCMLCLLMGGGAAGVLVGLGGASVTPGLFALVFLLLRLILPGANQLPLIRRAVVANSVFLAFAAYATASAMIMPRIFKGGISLAPLKVFGTRFIYETKPLEFSGQNITSSFNIWGSFMMAVAAYTAARQPRGAVAIVQAATVMVLLHAFLGISGALLHGTPYDTHFLRLFRNGSYYQLDQTVAGFVRINGIFPETSGYSAFGFIWMVFLAECWLRGIMPRRTGIAALAMVLILIMTTSSTAYVSLAVYAAILLVRVLLFSQSFEVSKGLIVGAVALVAFIGISALMLAKPAIAALLGNILVKATVDKGESESGLQRAFWARQGFDAFLYSRGLGVGAGSFRSSSLFTAILGSMGVIGILTFVIYLANIFKPLRASTFAPPADAIEGVGVAAAWAAIMLLVPAALGSPSPDPGLNFAMLAGIAIALRSQRVAAPVAEAAGRRPKAIPSSSGPLGAAG